MYKAHIQEAKKNFSSQGFPEKWLRLTPRYKAWKESKYPGRPILVLTGGLKKSMISGGPDHVKIIRKLSAIFGSKADLANIHQDHPTKARPVIQYPPAIFKKFKNILLQYIRSL